MAAHAEPYRSVERRLNQHQLVDRGDGDWRIMSEAGVVSDERPRTRSRYALILKEDPDLGHGLSAADRRAAVSLFRAPLLEVSPPCWEPPDYPVASTFGLLILDGLIGRRVKLGRAAGTELLGCGDIVRPWEEPFEWELIPAEREWRVFAPARVAVLDERITVFIGRHPQLILNFSGRLLRRACVANYLMVVSHLPRVEDRVLATLWHIASCWGRVTPNGVTIPFRLTHELLGEIVGAYRPSITAAMQTLASGGRVQRTPQGGFILIGEPPDWNTRESNAGCVGRGDV